MTPRDATPHRDGHPKSAREPTPAQRRALLAMTDGGKPRAQWCTIEAVVARGWARHVFVRTWGEKLVITAAGRAALTVRQDILVLHAKTGGGYLVIPGNATDDELRRARGVGMRDEPEVIDAEALYRWHEEAELERLEHADRAARARSLFALVRAA